MTQNDSKMWLSEEVLNWESVIFQTSRTESQSFFRAYEFLQHAESLIASNANDLQLADGISNLKRALNQRLKYIDELYSVSAAFPRNFSFLEALQELGLARPFVIKQLLEIRNDIEHNDATPPTRPRCLELLDITWYLLKSTDSICASRRASIDLKYGETISYDSEYLFSVYPQQSKGSEVKFRGQLPAFVISRDEQPGFFQFDCEEIHTKKEMAGRINEIHSDMKSLAAIRLQTMRHDDLYAVGIATLQPHLYKAVLKRLLATTPGFS